MIEKKVIIVDDDPIILEVAKASLKQSKFEVFSTTNPKEAIEEYLKNPTLVFISDLNMPEISGSQIVDQLLKAGKLPTFIVLTAKSDINTAIELFQKGIHDYILKPFATNELITKVNKAFEFAEMKMINQNIEKERELRIQHQLDWNLFKEGLIKKETDKTDSGLMTSINSSLVQGAGLGALSPLVALIKDTAILDGEYFKIEKDLIETLIETTSFSDKLIVIIGEIDYIINNELEKKAFSIKDLKNLIEDIILENKTFIENRNHQVKVSDFNIQTKIKIMINEEYCRAMFKELLFNALKFSDANSKVYVLFETNNDSFNVSFLNTPEQNSTENQGINNEFQSLIFEPFFRISRGVHEQYETLDFGLGLTLVDKIVRNHKAKIRINNLKNFLENMNTFLISFTIEFPYTFE